MMMGDPEMFPPLPNGDVGSDVIGSVESKSSKKSGKSGSGVKFRANSYTKLPTEQVETEVEINAEDESNQNLKQTTSNIWEYYQYCVKFLSSNHEL